MNDSVGYSMDWILGTIQPVPWVFPWSLPWFIPWNFQWENLWNIHSRGEGVACRGIGYTMEYPMGYPWDTMVWPMGSSTGCSLGIHGIDTPMV